MAYITGLATRLLATDLGPGSQQQLIRTALVTAPLSTVGALVCTLQYTDATVFGALKIWLALYAAVSLARVLLALGFMRQASAGPQHWRWALWGLVGSMLHGLLWGALSLVVRVPGSEQAEAVLHIVLAAVSMGTLHLSVAFPVLVAYVACALGTLVLRDAMLGGPFQGVMGTMSFFIATYALLNGHSQAKALREIAAQRRSNADLIEALRQENVRSEAARRSAEEANAARSRFFAAANHDLRQPLHAMGLLAQTLVIQGSTRHEVELAQHMEECVDGMAHVIDDLLDLTRLDVGNMVPQCTSFALDALVQECCRIHQAMARLKGLQLVAEPSAAWVHTDRALLARVLSNLLSNAVRYTATGTVRVSAIRLEQQLDLCVEDTGIGIATEHLAHIFEEFYQVGNPARDRRAGLGLGLASVQRLSELLGLKVTVRSTLCQGSAFTLTLPLASVDDSTMPTHSRETVQSLPDARRVLVIEDDADSRQALCGLLQSWGCEPRAAAGQEEALALLRAGFAPEALIADLRLADGASGIEATEAVRRSLGRVLPAVIMTGDAGSAHMQAAQMAGLAVMLKPVRAVQLRAFLGQAFAER